jgi:hypothetical protein
MFGGHRPSIFGSVYRNGLVNKELLVNSSCDVSEYLHHNLNYTSQLELAIFLFILVFFQTEAAAREHAAQ